MVMLEVRLLGKFEVSRDGNPIAIASRPAQSLFAYLILSAGTSHRREKLAGLLWPDSLEETARDNLRHALWRVRKTIRSQPKAEYLLTDDLSITFNASAEYWLDVAELDKLSENASADELIAVLSNYHGELLPGFYEEWVIFEREHLYSIFEHHMARLMSLLQDEKRWLDILDWGERWIKLGQKPEPAYRALMSAHAAKGDMSKVAATYERCVKSLKEFGIEPSEQTKELYENLKLGKGIPKTVSVSTKPFAKEPSANIPVPFTSFIGREKELNEIARLLSISRLLTLTGPGGVGKTRLAIQTAHDSTKKFKDSVFWVSLVGLSDGNLIPQEIAQSLNVRETSDEPLIETLITYLKPKDILLVIDNCEHLIKNCAQYAEELLVACPKLKVLATSIEALGLFNESTWQVPSLPLPEKQQQFSLTELQEFASIELFHERARNAKSNFVLDERNASSIAQICHRLDGIPLAIELAAARIKMLSVDEIAARLDDRFSLLTSGSRTAIPRHQTLRATIDWSYDLLTESERILLRRLAVFAGGFTLEAAESVCSGGMKRSDILDLLGRLVDKSLVIVDEISKVSETRYRLLETIRQYALEKLAGIEEAGAVRDRHLEFFVKLAEKAEANTFGAESVRYSKQRNQELDNTRAAMDWSIQSRQTIATFRLAAAMSNFWFVGLNDIGFQRSSISEWHGILNTALLSPEGLEHTAERAKALNASGFFYWAGMSLVSPRREIEEALSIGRELGDDAVVAQALCNLGLIESIQGNYAQARSLLKQGLDLFQKLGPERKTEYLYSQIVLGDVAMHQDDLPEAQMLYEQCSRTLREMHDGNFLAYVVRRLGQLAWHRGEFEKATELCKESLKLDLELGDERAVLACLSAFAGIALTRGNDMRTAQLFGAVSALLDARTIRLLPTDQTEYDRNVSSLRSQLDATTLENAWAKGRMMTIEQAIDFALEKT
jgi:predicted ATPase/DNA-binding SARP family transcriptional activator